MVDDMEIVYIIGNAEYSDLADEVEITDIPVETTNDEE